MTISDVIQIGISCIVSAGGVSGIIILAVKFTSGIIADRLEKKYELKLQKELENYKLHNRKKEYVSKARFDRAFAMYQELSEKHITMVYDAGEAVLVARGIYEDEDNRNSMVGDFIERFCEHCNEAQVSNKRFAPFISKEIFDKYCEIEQLGSTIFSLTKDWNAFVTKKYPETIQLKKQGKIIQMTQQSVREELEANQKKLSKASDEILDILRNYLSNLDIIEEK